MNKLFLLFFSIIVILGGCRNKPDYEKTIEYSKNIKKDGRISSYVTYKVNDIDVTFIETKDNLEFVVIYTLFGDSPSISVTQIIKPTQE